MTEREATASPFAEHLLRRNAQIAQDIRYHREIVDGFVKRSGDDLWQLPQDKFTEEISRLDSYLHFECENSKGLSIGVPLWVEGSGAICFTTLAA